MEIYCKVMDYGLVPMSEMDWDFMCRLSRDAAVRCSITMPRNIHFHRKFFALVTLTLDNLPETVQREWHIDSVDAMLAAVKIILGYYDIVHIGDKDVVRLRSISFAKMDDAAFARFYDMAITAILNVFLRGTDRRALIEEVESFISRR